MFYCTIQAHKQVSKHPRDTSNRPEDENPNSFNVVRRREQQVSERQSEGERETREEAKCNRGFIVCGSLGRERIEGRRGREQDEGRR